MPSRRHCSWTACLSLLVLIAMAAPPIPAQAAAASKRGTAASEPIRVVYHFSEGAEQALRGMRNIHNHLNADPTAKIVVVALGHGIDFLLDAATDSNGQPFDASVAALTARGVEFRICANTLRSRDIAVSEINPEAVVVPSGVAEIARLQAREGHAYIRP